MGQLPWDARFDFSFWLGKILLCTAALFLDGFMVIVISVVISHEHNMKAVLAIARNTAYPCYFTSMFSL